MKNQYKIIYLFLVFLLASSCEKDNYEAPNASIFGSIIDKVSGEKIPQQTLNGGKIRLFEVGYSKNPLPINTSMLADGNYHNDFIFNGKYKVVAEGPFTYLDTVTVDVNGKTKQDLKVTPYLKVTCTVVSKTNTTVTIKVSALLDAANTQKIARVGAVLGTGEGVDINNYFNASARPLENTEAKANELVNGTDYTFTITGLKANTKYYLRGAARTINTGSFYNYTPLMEVTTEP